MKNKITSVDVASSSLFVGDTFGQYWILRGNDVSSRGYINSLDRYERVLLLQMAFIEKVLAEKEAEHV